MTNKRKKKVKSMAGLLKTVYSAVRLQKLLMQNACGQIVTAHHKKYKYKQSKLDR